MMFFEDYIKDKRVALVGPASQTEIMSLGPLIDSYDIVARIGYYYPSDPAQTGSRTDIICENFWFWDPKYAPMHIDKKGLYDLWVKEGTKWVYYVWPDSSGYTEFKVMNQRRMQLYNMSDGVSKEIRQKYTRNPTKGICAILGLSFLPLKELFLVGFSASHGFGYRKQYVDNPFNMPSGMSGYLDPNETSKRLNETTLSKNNTDHDIKTEFMVMKRLVDGKRITADPWLQKVLCSQEY